MTMSVPTVNVKSLTRNFGSGDNIVNAVRSIDLELSSGEIVLIMGPSGSGKTTLLTMLGGLLRPTSGSITIDDTDIAILSERELPRFRARKVGFIFQDFNLLAALSAHENVQVALDIGGTEPREAHTRAAQLLALLGMKERSNFPVEKLSGGEKQRVAIARAIANQPVLILADEPTANLDSHHGAETMRLLRELAREHGTTVVIASHDERLREIADRVLWLEDGRFKELAKLVRDPSCGMLIDPTNALAHIEEDKTQTYFCSIGCRNQYIDDRARSSATNETL